MCCWGDGMFCKESGTWLSAEIVSSGVKGQGVEVYLEVSRKQHLFQPLWPCSCEGCVWGWATDEVAQCSIDGCVWRRDAYQVMLKLWMAKCSGFYLWLLPQPLFWFCWPLFGWPQPRKLAWLKLNPEFLNFKLFWPGKPPALVLVAASTLTMPKWLMKR